MESIIIIAVAFFSDLGLSMARTFILYLLKCKKTGAPMLLSNMQLNHRIVLVWI